MTLILFLGLFGFIYLSWTQFLESWRKIWIPLRTRVQQNDVSESNFFLLLRKVIVLSLTDLQFSNVIEEIFQSKKILRPRFLLLSLAFSILLLGVPLVLALFLFQVNPMMMMGLSFCFWLVSSLRFFTLKGLKNFSEVLFYFSLILFGFDLLSRYQFILKGFEEMPDIAFFLADGRPGNLFLIAVFGLVLTLLFKGPLWSWIVAALFFLGFQISLNGGVALVAGEIFALLLIYALRAHRENWSQARGVLLCALGGVLIGFLIFGYLREPLSLGEESAGPSFISLILGWFIVLVPAFVFASIAGHFLSRK